MEGLRVFDTNAMIAVSQGQLALEGESLRVAISIITRLELLSWPELSQSDLELVRQMIEAVDVIPINEEVVALAVEVRRARRLKLPDAIVAATAMSLNTVLVSNDSGFSDVPGLTVERF